MPSPILARADALMHRKRQSDNELDDLPVLTDAIDEDDIPILLDAETSLNSAIPTIEDTPLVAAEADIKPEVEALAPTASTPIIDPALRDQLIRELAHRVERRLSAELPGIIESTVRDFLAEQAMIDALPPND